jgi:hypothetical protein
MIKTTSIIQRNGLLYRLTEAGQFLCAKRFDILSDLRWADGALGYGLCGNRHIRF